MDLSAGGFIDGILRYAFKNYSISYKYYIIEKSAAPIYTGNNYCMLNKYYVVIKIFLRKQKQKQLCLGKCYSKLRLCVELSCSKPRS